MDQRQPPLVAVLGASGFIGSAVVRELAGRAVRLRTVARRRVVLPRAAVAEHEHLTADLTEAGAMASAVADADAVIYLVAHITGPSGWRAAEDDPEAVRVNLAPLRSLTDALRDAPRHGPPPVVVFAGTTMQAGLAATTRIDGSEPDRPETPYPRQKLAAERLLKQADADGVLHGISLRLPTVYGHVPGSAAGDLGVVSVMVRRALSGQGLTMWNDGAVRRDLVHVEDVARAFVGSLDHATGLRGRHWVVGSGLSVSLRELFGGISTAVAAHTGGEAVPVDSVPPPQYAERGDFHSVEVDASKFRRITGWRPRVALTEGLTRTVASLNGQRAAG
ncbi:NAD-dependent epimerase/dehydratase [Streptomyces sp. NPDC006645]|uniref:NAD-dependent epimerase/dehydratase family protein n=1 Tax=unclassified Streptomyces TaxID=2593676 RepID=UPI0033BAEBB8